MTRFFVICQGGFGVIERIREEIDFGKKITFTVNHCDHVILTWIFFKLILNSQIGVNICISLHFSPQNDLKSRSHAFFLNWLTFSVKNSERSPNSTFSISNSISHWILSHLRIFWPKKCVTAEKTCDRELSLYLYQDRYPWPLGNHQSHISIEL